MQIFKKVEENYKSDIPKVEEVSTRYDKKFLEKLGELYNQLTGEKLDKNKIYDSIEILNKIRSNQEKTYLKALLFPEKVRGARIPSKFPTPSIAFTSTDTLLITTNALGNFQLQWSPCQLLTTTGTELYLNNAPTLTGFTLDSNYTAQSALVNSYFSCLQAFRVVSACCIIQYVGSFQDTRGVLGGSLDVQPGASTANTSYSIFSNIDDKLYSQKTSPENGLKLNYFPVDSTDSLFLQVNSTLVQNFVATHIQMHVYGQGLPPSTQCIRVDFVKNCEAVPGPSGQDLLTTGFEIDYSESGDAFLKASKTVADNFLAVTSLTENKELAKVMNMPGNDYKTVLSKAKLEQRDDNRIPKINSAIKQTASQNFIPTDLVLKDPKEININPSKINA